MTRKDYILIADIIAQLSSFTVIQKQTLAQVFAIRLELDNPRFNSERFYKACGVEV